MLPPWQDRPDRDERVLLVLNTVRLARDRVDRSRGLDDATAPDRDVVASQIRRAEDGLRAAVLLAVQDWSAIPIAAIARAAGRSESYVERIGSPPADDA